MNYNSQNSPDGGALENQRDAAVLAAAAEAQRRQEAEAQAIDATVVAGAAAQDAINARTSADNATWNASRLAAERNILADNLAVERESAATSNFGMVLMACLILAALIGMGIWYFTTNGSQPASQAVQSSPVVEHTIVKTVPSRPNTVLVPVMPASPPQVTVHNDIHQAPAPALGGGVSTGTGTVTAPETTTPSGASSSTGTGSGSDNTSGSASDSGSNSSSTNQGSGSSDNSSQSSGSSTSGGSGQ